MINPMNGYIVLQRITDQEQRLPSGVIVVGQRISKNPLVKGIHADATIYLYEESDAKTAFSDGVLYDLVRESDITGTEY